MSSQTATFLLKRPRLFEMGASKWPSSRQGFCCRCDWDKSESCGGDNSSCFPGANLRGSVMKTCMTAVYRSILLVFCAFTLPPAVFAATQPDGHWIGTWAAPPEARRSANDLLGKVNTTYREIVHVSAGGSSVRVVLKNELGLESLTVSTADI